MATPMPATPLESEHPPAPSADSPRPAPRYVRADRSVQRRNRIVRLGVLAAGLVVVDADRPRPPVGLGQGRGRRRALPLRRHRDPLVARLLGHVPPAHRGVERRAARHRLRHRPGLPPLVLRLHLPPRRPAGAVLPGRGAPAGYAPSHHAGGPRPPRSPAQVRGVGRVRGVDLAGGRVGHAPLRPVGGVHASGVDRPGRAIGEFTVGFVVLGVTVVGSVVYDRFFCRYLCPMGAFLALVSRRIVLQGPARRLDLHRLQGLRQGLPGRACAPRSSRPCRAPSASTAVSASTSAR